MKKIWKIMLIDNKLIVSSFFSFLFPGIFFKQQIVFMWVSTLNESKALLKIHNGILGKPKDPSNLEAEIETIKLRINFY